MRGSRITRGCDPSPVSHLTMRATLSHKGRGEVRGAGRKNYIPPILDDIPESPPVNWPSSK
jgi:hypothetical protein